MSHFNVEAEWHMELKDKRSGKVYAHRVKVKVLDPDLGFYINGMVVYLPDGDKFPNLTVTTPKAGNARIIEFAGKSSILWKEIKQACEDVVNENLRMSKLDKVVEDFDENEPINLDDIPF
jgi:hypothetical protein